MLGWWCGWMIEMLFVKCTFSVSAIREWSKEWKEESGSKNINLNLETHTKKSRKKERKREGDSMRIKRNLTIYMFIIWLKSSSRHKMRQKSRETEREREKVHECARIGGLKECSFLPTNIILLYVSPSSVFIYSSMQFRSRLSLAECHIHRPRDTKRKRETARVKLLCKNVYRLFFAHWRRWFSLITLSLSATLSGVCHADQLSVYSSLSLSNTLNRCRAREIKTSSHYRDLYICYFAHTKIIGSIKWRIFVVCVNARTHTSSHP